MERATTPAITLKELTVNYQKSSVLWDLSTEIPKGSLTAVIGPNGAGKSTLLKACMGLVKQMSGSVLFLNQPLSSVRKKVAYVPQRASIDWDFPITALEVVRMGLRTHSPLFSFNRSKEKEEARASLKQLSMDGFEHREIASLSGGQQQRLFIARALLQKADIYLMDEPFAGIDLTTETMLAELFKTLALSGKTIVIVHHDLVTAKKYFTHAILLNTCLIAAGPIHETLTHQNILKTYGRSASLLDEAALLVQTKSKGGV